MHTLLTGIDPPNHRHGSMVSSRRYAALGAVRCDAAGVAALALLGDDRMRVLVANLSAAPQAGG